MYFVDVRKELFVGIPKVIDAIQVSFVTRFYTLFQSVFIVKTELAEVGLEHMVAL